MEPSNNQILDSIMLGHINIAIGYLKAAMNCVWGYEEDKQYEILKEVVKKLSEEI